MQNHSLMRELIDIFRSQVESVTVELSDCVTDACWKFKAHTLKGAAASMGAVEIQMLSALLEEKPCPKRMVERHNTQSLLIEASRKFFAEADRVMRQIEPLP